MITEEQILRLIELAKANGYDEAASWLKVQLPTKRKSFLFTLAKEFSYDTGELQHRIEVRYPDDEGNGPMLPRKSIAMQFVKNEPDDIPFYICVKHLMSQICDERIALARSKKAEMTD